MGHGNLKVLGITGDTMAESELINFLWRPVINQKMALVCCKTGSDEIVGFNMNFVASKDEHFFENVQRKVVDLELLGGKI